MGRIYCRNTAAIASIPGAGSPRTQSDTNTHCSPTHPIIQTTYPLTVVYIWVEYIAGIQQLLPAYRARGPRTPIQPGPTPIRTPTVAQQHNHHLNSISTHSSISKSQILCRNHIAAAASVPGAGSPNTCLGQHRSHSFSITAQANQHSTA